MSETALLRPCFGDDGEVYMEPTAGVRREYLLAVKYDPCAYCGARPGGTRDHIIPKGDGGTGAIDNFTGACKRCNGTKGTTPLLMFLLGEPPQGPGVAQKPEPTTQELVDLVLKVLAEPVDDATLACIESIVEARRAPLPDGVLGSL